MWEKKRKEKKDKIQSYDLLKISEFLFCGGFQKDTRDGRWVQFYISDSLLSNNTVAATRLEGFSAIVQAAINKHI